MVCSLASCTRGYTVDILLRDNRVVFQFGSDWLGGNKPAPLQRLWVRELSGDSPVVWQLESVDYNGRRTRELAYGAVPSGMKEKISAAPLRVGQLYRAELLALGGGSSKEFVISPDPNSSAERLQVLHE